MLRLQAVLRAAGRRPGTGWAGLAMECGYCDQSHLIRDFQQFAGQPPETLLRDGSDWARYFTGNGRSRAR
jgi:AraC-like DNA-binding protein